MSQSVTESVSLLQGYPYAALHRVPVWVSEIQVKVSVYFRNTGLYYTKVILEIRFLLYEGEETKITLCENKIQWGSEREDGLLDALHAAVTYCSM